MLYKGLLSWNFVELDEAACKVNVKKAEVFKTLLFTFGKIQSTLFPVHIRRNSDNHLEG